jgi:hypothetical protein
LYRKPGFVTATKQTWTNPAFRSFKFRPLVCSCYCMGQSYQRSMLLSVMSSSASGTPRAGP